MTKKIIFFINPKMLAICDFYNRFSISDHYDHLEGSPEGLVPHDGHFGHFQTRIAWKYFPMWFFWCWPCMITLPWCQIWRSISCSSLTSPLPCEQQEPFQQKSPHSTPPFHGWNPVECKLDRNKSQYETDEEEFEDLNEGFWEPPSTLVTPRKRPADDDYASSSRNCRPRLDWTYFCSKSFTY